MPETPPDQNHCREGAAQNALRALESIAFRDGQEAAREHALGLLLGAGTWLHERADPLYAATALSKVAASLSTLKDRENG